MKTTTLETTTNLEQDRLQAQLTKLHERNAITQTQLVAQWLLDKHSKLYCQWVKT